jgi:hypothetical protein
MGISLYRDPTGEIGVEVRCLPGTSKNSKRGLWKRRFCLYGGSVRGTWREGSFTGDTEGCVKEGCGNGHPPCRPLGGPGGDAALPGTLREM